MPSPHVAQAQRWTQKNTKPQNEPLQKRSKRSTSQPPATAQAARWAARDGNATAPEEESVPAPRRADTSFAETELEARRSGRVACDPWAPLARAAAINGETPASIRDEGTGRCFSYREAAARAARVGAWLRTKGQRRCGSMCPVRQQFLDARRGAALPTLS